MAYKVEDIAVKLLALAANDHGADLMTNLKLQKMLYYEQGFHLAYFGTPLFEEEIEAWMYGPVVPAVYNTYSQYGRGGIDPGPEETITLSGEKEEALFMEVYQVYGAFSAIGLMNKTHEEMPWKTTPTGSGHIITKDKMREYFKKRLK